MAEPIYVIPDIHGYRSELDRVLDRVALYGGEDARIVFLGDYSDRGPDSRGALQTLIDGIAAGRNWIALRGNHGQMFLDALEGRMERKRFQWWMRDNLGGRETLASYGVDTPDYKGDWREQVPGLHRQFLSTLPYTHETDDLFLCHAGISPGTPLERQVPEDLMWIREPFLNRTENVGIIVILHDLNLALRYATHIVALKKGQIGRAHV